MRKTHEMMDLRYTVFDKEGNGGLLLAMLIGDLIALDLVLVVVLPATLLFFLRSKPLSGDLRKRQTKADEEHRCMVIE